jgi:1,2-diacylglycerol 3-alpha-glucosyltransferase
MNRDTSVLIVCPGLGRILRGFESFFAAAFEALRGQDAVDLYLFKGAGRRDLQARALWNLPRNGRVAKLLGRAVGRSGYFFEQVSFFVSLLPHLRTKRPSVVYVSDVVLANLLAKARRFFGYRVLYCNAGPTLPRFLHRWEHIHQVSPQYLDAAVADGVGSERQTLLPYGVPIAPEPSFPQTAERASLREKLGLPVERPVLLSVGAINRSRKRMDYLIQEVASMGAGRPYLLLVGALEEDSDALVRMGQDLLPGGFGVRSVEREQVRDYYRAADAFALASVAEGFGLVYVEALSHGLPCLVHDYPTSRFVLGDVGNFGDFLQPGSLAAMIRGLTEEDLGTEAAQARHRWAYERFSWDRLGPKYIEMFRRCAGGGDVGVCGGARA